MKKLLVNIVAVVSLFTFVIAFGTVSFLAFDIPLQALFFLTAIRRKCLSYGMAS